MAELIRHFEQPDGRLTTSDDEGDREKHAVPEGGVFVYSLVKVGEREYILKIPVSRELVKSANQQWLKDRLTEKALGWARVMERKGTDGREEQPATAAR